MRFKQETLMVLGIGMGLLTLGAMLRVERPTQPVHTPAPIVRRAVPTVMPRPRVTPRPQHPTGREADAHGAMVDWCRQDMTTRLQRKPTEMQLRECVYKEFKRIDEAARK